MAARLSSIFLSLLLLFLPFALGISDKNGEGFSVNGKVRFPEFSATGFGLPAKLSNVKVILNGGQKVTFLRPDGYFSLSELMSVLGILIREPFSVMSILKSPMGLMIGFMVIVMFVMPKLVDPEELKRAQEEMGNQGVPSLANFLTGAQQRNN